MKGGELVLLKAASGYHAALVVGRGHAGFSVRVRQDDTSRCAVELTEAVPIPTKEGLICRWTYALSTERDVERAEGTVADHPGSDPSQTRSTEAFSLQASKVRPAAGDLFSVARARAEFALDYDVLANWCEIPALEEASGDGARSRHDITVTIASNGDLEGLAINGVDQHVSVDTCSNAAGLRMFSNASGKRQVASFALDR
jgi:hypothetical protein